MPTISIVLDLKGGDRVSDDVGKITAGLNEAAKAQDKYTESVKKGAAAERQRGGGSGGGGGGGGGGSRSAPTVDQLADKEIARRKQREAVQNELFNRGVFDDRERAKQKRESQKKQDREDREADKKARQEKSAAERDFKKQEQTEKKAESSKQREIEKQARAFEREGERANLREQKKDRDEIRQRKQEGIRTLRQQEKQIEESAKEELREKKKSEAKAKEAKAKAEEQSAARGRLGIGALAASGMGGVAGKYSQIAGLGEVASDAGFGGAGKFLSRAALPIALAAGGLAVGRDAGVNFRDPYQTNSQAARNTLNGTAIGRFAVGTVEDIGGRTSRMDRARERYEAQSEAQPVRFAEAEYARSLRGSQAAARGGVESFRGAQAVTQQNTARETVAQRTAYREEAQLLSLRQAQAKATRETAAARYAELAASKELNNIEAKLNVNEGNQKFLRAERDSFGGGWSGPERADAAGRLELAQKEGLNLLDMKRRAAADLSSRKEATGQAAYAEANAGLNVQRGQLDILQARETKARDQSANLSALGPGGRTQALQAFRAIKAMGDISNVPPALVAQAAQAFPEEIRAMQEKGGQKYFDEFRRESPSTYRDRYTDVAKQVDEVGASVARGQLNADKQLAGSVETSLQPLKTGLESFAREVSLTLQKYEDGLKFARTMK